MKKSIHRMIVALLVVCLLVPLAGCSEEGFRVGTASFPDNFYSHITYQDFFVYVNDEFRFEEEEVSVKIADSSIIDITYELEEDRLFDAGIKFHIKCLAPGTTTFYFEVPSLDLKTDTIEITVQENVEDIHFKKDSAIHMTELHDIWNREFTVDKFEYDTLTWTDELQFVSEDPNVATIQYDTDAKGLQCKIESVGYGETFVYIQTQDGSVQSSRIQVIVEKEEAEQETILVPAEPEDNSRTVYITPYGKKYHYSQACAGKNASETTEDKASDTHDPCKKCVH